MKATAQFRVISFDGTELTPAPGPSSPGRPTGVAGLEKEYEGEITGRSATIFVSAFDPGRGLGSYVAMESFRGSLHDRSGAFNFVHAASTAGSDRSGEYFAIVTDSGTDELAGITGSGGMQVHPDGRHEVWFDYDLG
jgi:hypothetical protein